MKEDRTSQPRHTIGVDRSVEESDGGLFRVVRQVFDRLTTSTGGAQMPRPEGYYVPAEDWPLNAQPGDLPTRQIYDIFDDFDTQFDRESHRDRGSSSLWTGHPSGGWHGSEHGPAFGVEGGNH